MNFSSPNPLQKFCGQVIQNSKSVLKPLPDFIFYVSPPETPKNEEKVTENKSVNVVPDNVNNGETSVIVDQESDYDDIQVIFKA